MDINLPFYDDNFFVTAAALSNSGGGVIRLGVDDKGEGRGLPGYKTLLEILPKLCRERLSLELTASLRYAGEYHYLEVKIPPSSLPVIYEGRILVRSDNDNVPLEQKGFESLLKEHFPVISDYLPLGDSTVGEVLLKGEPGRVFPRLKTNIETSFSTALKELRARFSGYPEDIFRKTLLYFYLSNDYESGDVSTIIKENMVSVEIKGRAVHPYLEKAFEEKGCEVSLSSLNEAFDLASELGYPRPVLTLLSATIDTRHKREKEKVEGKKLAAEERVLALLENAGPLPLGEISERMKFSNHTAHTLLSSLLDQGLVSSDGKAWCCSSSLPRDSL